MSLHLCTILFATATVVAQVKQYVSLRDAVWDTFYPLSSFVYFSTILFLLKILSFQQAFMNLEMSIILYSQLYFILLQTMAKAPPKAPPKYDDLGKECRDVFGKGYGKLQ